MRRMPELERVYTREELISILAPWGYREQAVDRFTKNGMNIISFAGVSWLSIDVNDDGTFTPVRPHGMWPWS